MLAATLYHNLGIKNAPEGAFFYYFLIYFIGLKHVDDLLHIPVYVRYNDAWQ
jgi:hypothetical protein